MITNVNHVFDRFISINTQTIEFPTEKTRLQRRKENPNDLEMANYEVFRTNDGLPIGVKLLVVYEIENPGETLKKLAPDQILSHIESIVTADMGMVIQNCGSTDFLKSNQTQARPTLKPTEAGGSPAPSAPEFYAHLQDLVKNQLCDDFAKYGIKLIRLNIETPKVLDQKISSEMARFSLMNSEASAKEAVMDRNANISKQQATIEAQQKEIAQRQENANVMAKAQTEMNAAKLKADAKIVEAEAENRMKQMAMQVENSNVTAKAQTEMNSAKLKADAKIVEAEAENRIKEMALQIAKQKGELYRMYPELLQFDLAQIQATALKGISSTIISDTVARNYYPGLISPIGGPVGPNGAILSVSAGSGVNHSENVGNDQNNVKSGVHTNVKTL